MLYKIYLVSNNLKFYLVFCKKYIQIKIKCTRNIKKAIGQKPSSKA